MKCMHCSAEMPLRAEHCPRCGQKSYANFDMLAQSVHEDAAVRRGLRIEETLRWILLGLVLLAAVLYACNDFFDKTLRFDGSTVPAIPAGQIGNPETPKIDVGYVDPRPPASAIGRAPRVFGYRYEPTRTALMKANHGDEKPAGAPRSVRESIDLGLKFLSAHQSSDGSFAVEAIPKSWPGYNTATYEWGRMGVTSLALLAFLGDGHTWLEEGGQKSIYQKQVNAAVKWIVQHQDASGLYGPAWQNDGVFAMYNHGMATLAICEAAGLSGDEYLRASAQRGLDFILKSQNNLDGWHEYPGADNIGDTSVSAWQVQALWAGREIGLNVPEEKLAKALAMYQKAARPDGNVVYGLNERDVGNKDFRPSLCGMGMMARLLLGDDKHLPVFQLMAQKITAALPKTQNNWGEDWKPNLHNDNDLARRDYDPYMVYYCTYGLFMLGGHPWDVWNEGMKKSILEMQSNDGGWRTNDVWTRYAGMNYSTALSVLTLQVYYRVQ